jgi:diguanylate cyclase (GGDEF)-like protein
MTEKNVRLAILNEARRSLVEGGLSAVEKEELLKLLELLITSIEKFTPDRDLDSEAHMLAANLVSSHAMLSLLKQQADELDALRTLSINLTSILDLPTVLNAVVREAMRLVNNTRAAHIFLYVNGKLEFGASLDNNGNRNKLLSEPRVNGLTNSVIQAGETVIVEDMKNHPIYQDAPPEWEGSIIGMPLKMGEKVVGVMNVSRDRIGGFNLSELRLLGMLADHAAVAISNASLHQVISEKAYSDTLTGLPNRRALDERLESEIKNAWRTGTKFAVIMMDLDGFKTVNDNYGHDFGDQVLKSIFNAIALGVRGSDFLARYGGDELTLILSQSDLPAAKMVTDKILENIKNEFVNTPDKGKLSLGISGGIAVYPVHGQSASELLRAADAALYTAKKHQRGKFVYARAATGSLDTTESTEATKVIEIAE